MKLLEAGSNPQIDFESWLKAAKFSKHLDNRLRSFDENKKMYERSVEQPLMIALKTCQDPEVLYRLLQRGADPNAMTPISYTLITDEWQRRYNKGETALDIVRKHLTELRKWTSEKLSATKPELPEGMDEYLKQFKEGSYQHWLVSEDIIRENDVYKAALKLYEEAKNKFDELKGVAEKREAVDEAIKKMEKVEDFMLEKGAKTFKELHPELDGSTNGNNNNMSRNSTDEKKETKKESYKFNITFHNTTDVTETRRAAYIEL
jgi:hypothetical protein